MTREQPAARLVSPVAPAGTTRHLLGDAMIDPELIRTPGDRDRYALDGVGTLHLEGIFSRRATAEAAGQRWQIARRGFWRQLQATDAARVVVVGTFDRRLRGGGSLYWRGRRLALRRASMWRARYALADGDRELALLDATRWRSRPVTITVDDETALEPGLLLYATFVVRTLADDGSASTVAATTAATTSSG